MNLLTYIEKKDLFVLSVPAIRLKKETKDSIEKDLKEKTGVKNVLVIEGNFEYIPEGKYSERTLFYGSDGLTYEI